MPTSKLKLLDDPTLSDADWSTNPPLSAEVFISTVTYDALNRPLTSTDPGGNIQTYTYDRGGVLKTVKLNTDIYIADLHYDAKGQRQAVWYGNGTKTSYTYDPFTFRLRRLLTVKLSTNEILQDLHYWYDPVGNITEIQDDAQQTLFFNNSVVTPTQGFTYDALYRLMEAKGRELIGTASFGAEDNWNDAAWQTTHKGDGNALQNYTQLYTYDEVGNILQLRHVAGIGSYTRDYTIDSASNRMKETEVGINTHVYKYDTRGNMSEMPHLDDMKWNISNELYKTENGTMEAYYQYSGGQRIRKWVDKGSIKEERIYLGSFEIYRKFEGSSLKIERQTVHVSDDSGRIAMLEKRTVGSSGDDNGTDALLTRYIYSNHLQSASLELDEDGEIINYEEYHPYGTTSYQATNASIKAVAKRYRYTGKERDEESGLYYHGARYYVPWLGRWTASDPLQYEMPTWSPYNYGFCNPVKWKDSTGMQPDGDEKTGVWYWDDNKNKYLFDKEHTYQTFTDTETKHKRGVNFFVPAMGKEYGQKEEGSYYYKDDGTSEYHPPIMPTDEELKAEMAWGKVGEGKYEYMSRYEANKRGVGQGRFDFFREGEENGVRYKRDGTKEYYKEKIYGSVNVASTTTPPQPKTVDTPVAITPPKPPVTEPPKPSTPLEAPKWVGDIGTVSNTAGIGSSVKHELIDFAIRDKGSYTRNTFRTLSKEAKVAQELEVMGSLGSKYLRFSKGLGAFGNIINVGTAATQFIAHPTLGSGVRLGVQGLAIGFNAIPVFGWGLSLGLNTLDLFVGDRFYNWLDGK